MAIIVVPEAQLSTYDAQTGQLITRYNIINLATRRVAIFCDSRWLWCTNLANNRLTPLDLTKDPANQGDSIVISNNPNGIWGDGRFLWTVTGAGTVSQIDINLGTTVGTYTLSQTYSGMAGNGRSFWIINTTSGNIEQYDQNWTLMGTFTGPTNARGLYYDGRFLWVSSGVVSTQGTIKQFDPNTGTELGSFNTHNYGLQEQSYCLAGNGRYLYLTEARTT